MNKAKVSQFWRALLILGLLTCMAAPLQAATGYEVTSVNLVPTVTADQFVRMTDDNLSVSWTAPAPSGADVVLNYFIKINTSSTQLTGTALDDTTYDFKTTAAESFANIPKATFDTYDSDKLRYLHIRTQYLISGTGSIAYSDDVVVGPIRIDNVAPTGTITLTPTSGSSVDLTVKVFPSPDTQNYWISSSASYQPVEAEKLDYTISSEVVGSFFSAYPATPYGKVTIRAWFRDRAGNMTTGPAATADYDYQAPVAINHNNIFQIAVDGELGFTVDQSTAYNWTITDPSVAGVVEFSGSSTGVASAKVIGKKAGTFTITATAGSTTLKTGTITVVQTTTSKAYSLITTGTTSVNAIALSRSGTGWVKASDLYAAVPNCNDLSRWSAELQAYESYVPFANDFNLVVGEPYFVNVSSPGTFTVTGSVPALSFTLKTTGTTSVNAISLPQSKSGLTKGSQLIGDIPGANDLSRWSATMQAYESYVPFANDFDVAVDEAYFVNVAGQVTWP